MDEPHRGWFGLGARSTRVRRLILAWLSLASDVALHPLAAPAGAAACEPWRRLHRADRSPG